MSDCCCAPRTVKVERLVLDRTCPTCQTENVPENEIHAYRRCESCYVGPHLNGFPVPVSGLGGATVLKHPKASPAKRERYSPLREEELEIQYA